jgi:hypothetical protein
VTIPFQREGHWTLFDNNVPGDFSERLFESLRAGHGVMPSLIIHFSLDCHLPATKARHDHNGLLLHGKLS